MRLLPTPLGGVFRVETSAHSDARGSFLRTYDHAAFATAGLAFIPCQTSLSVNPLRHTLRGMHWQADPHGEQKLVRCVAGAVYDVALDLRPGSPTRGQWHAETLSAGNAAALFLPQGVAHGFLTLTPDAVVEYQIDTPHAPAFARGRRWDDPAFGIAWPAPPALIGDKDMAWPLHG